MAEDKNMEERRSFEGPGGKTYYITAPNANDIREADWNYSRTYTRSLTEGIPTQAEMMDILRRRGIVGPEFEQRATELTSELNSKIWALDDADDVNLKRDLAVEVANSRDELFQWNQRLNGPMANSCEQLADDARLEYLTACMIADENDDKVWDSYDDYLKEKNQALALKSRFEIMLYLQGLESDFLEKTPEAMAMREVEADIIAKAAEATKALEAVEEEAEALAEKEKAKPKRKTTTKKTAKKKAKKKDDSGK